MTVCRPSSVCSASTAYTGLCRGLKYLLILKNNFKKKLKKNIEKKNIEKKIIERKKIEIKIQKI